MRPRTSVRPHLAGWICLLFAAGLAGCTKPPAGPPAKPAAVALADEIPADQLGPVLDAHYRGLGLMQQFQYAEAAKEFRRIRKLAPGWSPPLVNLAIALLNYSGELAEDAKKKQGPPPKTNFEEALELLDESIARGKNLAHAHYCRGIIYQFNGLIAEAHREYGAVIEIDPNDGLVWEGFASTFPRELGRPPTPEEYNAIIKAHEKALKCNPYLVTSIYKLSQVVGQSGDRARQKDLIELLLKIDRRRNAAAPGDQPDAAYGYIGKYATVIGPAPARNPPDRLSPPPRFEAPRPADVTLAPGDRWLKESDLVGPHAGLGRARARFGAGIAAFDADGDGKLDLYLTAAIVGPKGPRDCLLLNLGDGRFNDASKRFGLPDDRAGLGVAAGDFDADRYVDVFVTGWGDNRLLRNIAGVAFDDLTDIAGLVGPPAISITARWIDLDQDGDLDLYVVNHAKIAESDLAFTAKPSGGAFNSAYRNDGQPEAIEHSPKDNWAPLAVATPGSNAIHGLSIKLTPWPDAEALGGGERPHTGVAVLDIDDDRDLDLVLTADGHPPTVILNDRIGRFRSIPLGGEAAAPGAPVSGLLVADLDKDGHSEVVAVGPGRPVVAWKFANDRATDSITASIAQPTDARDWRAASAVDLDLDTWTDLVGLPSMTAPPTPVLARNLANRLVARPLVLGPDNLSGGGLQGFAVADMLGSPIPDLVILRDGQGPLISRNLGNANHWLALDLGGRWKTSFDHMRTNPHGLGVRLAAEGEGLYVPVEYTTPVAGPAQSVAPLVLGLGSAKSVPLIRIRWPDGVMQSELNVDADQLLPIAEYNRKTGSCPVLFTWNGERFDCIGDFLGGGGLGYLVAPGIYGQPDRDEAIAIAPAQLMPVGGMYRLAVSEPMDEVAYLDKLTLDVIDRPPGVQTSPDERFAPEGPRPSGELLAWRQQIEPSRATDLAGRDATRTLQAWDRDTVEFPLRKGWVGYAEEHGIVLDFGDRLAQAKPTDRLYLALAGWVEYPYSQTNYAAATAGVALSPPILERLQGDGTWEVIDANPGYPAGLPRLTLLDVTGKVSGPSCTLRLRTNMECYYDQAFVAVVPAGDPGVRVTSLPVALADLQYRGYTREVSPDGKLPLLYDHDYVDPAPLARLSGRLTRFGDVADLLRDDDDWLCLVGPGDEARLEFDATIAPPLPEGWSRAFILRSIGYCKDADPATALSDTIGPLPWKGMPPFPFGPEGERPRDPAYDEYLRTYQTRMAGD